MSDPRKVRPIVSFRKMKVWNTAYPNEIVERYVFCQLPSLTFLAVTERDYKLCMDDQLLEDYVEEWDRAEEV